MLIPLLLVVGAAQGDRPASAPTRPAPANPAIPAMAESARPPVQRFDHVVMISVDGLRSDALLALPPESLAGFARLEQGAYTLNARCDPSFSITLPNHTAMLTGRPVLGEKGHAWILNDEAEPGVTLHSNKGAYVASVFDVVHDRGVKTALFAGKPKFALYDVSYDAEHGAADVEGADDGKDKLDSFTFTLDTREITDGVVRVLKESGPRSLAFAHYAITDLTAHASGWDVTPTSKYMKAVVAVDAELRRLLDAIEQDPALARTTAIVLTADHGGGAPFKSHDQAHMWVDYVIPFVVWTGSPCAEHDLYALNAGTRADPGIKQIAFDAPGLQPVRNGDAGNLALSLLGLPAIPGSTIGARQDLRAR